MWNLCCGYAPCFGERQDIRRRREKVPEERDAADESEALAAADRRSTDFGSPAAEGPKVSLENGNMEEVSLGAEFQSEHMLPYKDLVLDLDSQSVWKGEEMISLTRTEFQILELFFSHPKKIYSMEIFIRASGRKRLWETARSWYILRI